MRKTEVPKQRVLDRNHVWKQKGVGVSRARGAYENVIDNRPVSHCDNSIREQERLVDVVRHEDYSWNRTARLFPEVEEDLLQLSPGNVVERAERLIEQKDLAAIGEHGGNGDSLEHAAGELARPGALHMRRPTRLR